eukprot:TRINITY_DN1159_c0_g1_i12.p1 TRINITY_DN1159_c0_g1~~TRINITY_DN1159_c0_g1_i12.p1  ORF type:complete len:227 (-),score=28.18 TRINITY_DN1159_c0_g1_i12:127-807(-)
MVVFGKFRPDDPEVEGMVSTGRQDALELMDTIYENWNPPRATWLLNNSHLLAGVAVAAPSVVMALRMRRLFGLDRERMSLSVGFLVPLAVNSPLASYLHRTQIRDDIVLHETDCSVCVDIRSQAIQISLGVVYPTVMTYLGAIATANLAQLRITPRSLKGFYVLTKGVAGKIGSLVAGMTLMQIVISGIGVRQLYDDRDQIMAELETRFAIMDQWKRRELEQQQFK